MVKPTNKPRVDLQYRIVGGLLTRKRATEIRNNLIHCGYDAYYVPAHGYTTRFDVFQSEDQVYPDHRYMDCPGCGVRQSKDDFNYSAKDDRFHCPLCGVGVDRDTIKAT